MMMKPPQKRSWWATVILDGQHAVFRVVSVAFSAVSAWAIYWMFAALGDQLIAVVTSVAFVALGYYVTRALAHRLMTKGRIWSFVWIMLIYAFVEVSCNFAHAAAGYADVTWISGLHGTLRTFFSYDLLVVLSIIPLFNFALAQIDVALMQEKGQIKTVASAQPKQAPAFKGMGSMAPASPQAGYGGNTAAQVGGPMNGLKQWWGNRSAQAGQAAQPVMPSPAAMSAMASYPSAPAMPGASNGGGMNGMNGIP